MSDGDARVRVLPEVRLVDGLGDCVGVDLVAVPAFAGGAGEAGGAGGRDGAGDAAGRRGDDAAAGVEIVDVAAASWSELPGCDPARHPTGFGAAVGEIRTVYAGSAGPEVVAVGLGRRADLTADRLRTAAMALGARARGAAVATTLALAGPDLAASAGAVTDGFLVGAYRYRDGGPGGPSPDRDGGAGEGALAICVGGGGDTPEVRRALAVAVRAGEATRWVRQMVDTPPSRLPPSAFAREIADLAAASGVECEVWTADRARAEGFGGTVGVGGGSANPPMVVHLRYRGTGDEGAPPEIGLAGKGITFDAGGIDLKRDPDEISWMKSDMAGAASVAAAVCAAADLGARQPVAAVLPLAENLPGRGALLPGDVVTHPDGSRTEVLDTDNEGRLVLADAVSYLVGRGVAAVVDVGTLTDGGALGHLLWGCWGTSAALLRDVVAAGERTGDPGWHLPLREEYRELFDSPVADRANRARDVPDTGAMAATFLRDFAGATAWVHVDNGSTAYLDADLPPWPAGSTGSPTRALLNLLMSCNSTEYTEC